MATKVLPDEWQEWASDLERTFIALLSICHLFATRDAEPTLSTLRGMVERITQRPLDETTLKLLTSLHKSVVTLDGKGNATVVHLACLGQAQAGQKRPHAEDAATQYQRRSFTAKVPPPLNR